MPRAPVLVLAAAFAIACDAGAYDPGAARARALRGRAAELARHLETLPGVTGASVLVVAPEADPLAPPRPAPPPRASVVLALAPGADRAAAEDAARRAVVAAVDGIAPRDVAITAAGPAAEPVVAVGPFRVAAGSAGAVRAALAAALALVAALAGWIAVSGARRYANRRGTRPQ